DGIRDRNVTGVQTCALPIFLLSCLPPFPVAFAPGAGGLVALLCEQPAHRRTRRRLQARHVPGKIAARWAAAPREARSAVPETQKNGRASCREGVHGDGTLEP